MQKCELRLASREERGRKREEGEGRRRKREEEGGRGTRRALQFEASLHAKSQA
jgi:hypothetical protein